MNKLRFTSMTLAVMTFSVVVFSSAQAQVRTWVSGVDDDINPCSRTAPAKLSPALFPRPERMARSTVSIPALSIASMA